MDDVFSAAPPQKKEKKTMRYPYIRRYTYTTWSKSHDAQLGNRPQNDATFPSDGCRKFFSSVLAPFSSCVPTKKAPTVYCFCFHHPVCGSFIFLPKKSVFFFRKAPKSRSLKGTKKNRQNAEEVKKGWRFNKQCRHTYCFALEHYRLARGAGGGGGYCRTLYRISLAHIRPENRVLLIAAVTYLTAPVGQHYL